MTKSLLDEVSENAKFLAPCPACILTPGLADTSRNQMGQGSNGVHKRGRWQGLYRSAMPVCRFCKGLRVVYLNRICECGMPAVYHHEEKKIWFCGAEDCARSAIYRLERQSYTGPMGPWVGLGGQEDDGGCFCG